MDKIRALYEYTEKVEIVKGKEKEILIVEEVFILKFLDGKNALVARKGGGYKPSPLQQEQLHVVGKDIDVVGVSTNIEVMPLDKLIILDVNTVPQGIVWRQEVNKLVF